MLQRQERAEQGASCTCRLLSEAHKHAEGPSLAQCPNRERCLRISHSLRLFLIFEYAIMCAAFSEFILCPQSLRGHAVTDTPPTLTTRPLQVLSCTCTPRPARPWRTLWNSIMHARTDRMLDQISVKASAAATTTRRARPPFCVCPKTSLGFRFTIRRFQKFLQ